MSYFFFIFILLFVNKVILMFEFKINIRMQIIGFLDYGEIVLVKLILVKVKLEWMMGVMDLLKKKNVNYVRNNGMYILLLLV